MQVSEVPGGGHVAHHGTSHVGNLAAVFSDDELKIIINYNRSIEYIVKKIRFFSLEEIYIMINEIEAEFKQEREILGNLLGKIIVTAKMATNGENLKKMISLKNSLRNNVNVRSILFNFFDTLQELV